MSQEALIVGGPNGAGKSPFAEAYVAERDLPFLSADAIARRLNLERPAQAKIGAARRFLRELDAHIGRGDDLVVESTLSGRGPRRWLRQMREASYAVSIVFLFVDTPETSIRRVEERVRKGGHHVPNEAVRRRYHRSIRNFPGGSTACWRIGGIYTTTAQRGSSASPVEPASDTLRWMSTF